MINSCLIFIFFSSLTCTSTLSHRPDSLHWCLCPGRTATAEGPCLFPRPESWVTYHYRTYFLASKSQELLGGLSRIMQVNPLAQCPTLSELSYWLMGRGVSYSARRILYIQVDGLLGVFTYILSYNLACGHRHPSFTDELTGVQKDPAVCSRPHRSASSRVRAGRQASDCRSRPGSGTREALAPGADCRGHHVAQ